MMTDDQILEVVQARKNGKQIEILYDTRHGYTYETWITTDIDSWDFLNHDYRVKPEPPKPREFWLCKYNSSPTDYSVWSHPVKQYNADEVIHVQEVLEDQP
jgi:hypothetical protein